MSSVVQTNSRRVLITASMSKHVQDKLVKGFLDVILLKFLHEEPMHGYLIILKVRKTFGTYYGPSTIYPMLLTLQKDGYVVSDCDMTIRAKKIYHLTDAGEDLLKFCENTLEFICRKLGE